MNQQITACALVFNDGKLLIAKRAESKKFLPGKYELPGGHIEYGEDIIEGLKREFREEFDVEIVVGEAVHSFTYMNGQNHVVEVDFLASLADPNTEIVINPNDHSEYRWVGKDDVVKYWDTADKEYKAIQQAFALTVK